MRGRADPSKQVAELRAEAHRLAAEKAEREMERIRLSRALDEFPRRLATARAGALRGRGDDELSSVSAEVAETQARIAELDATIGALTVAGKEVAAEVGALYAEHRDHFLEVASQASERYAAAERALRDGVVAAEAAWSEVARAWQVVPWDREAHPNGWELPVRNFGNLRFALAQLGDRAPYPRGMGPVEHAEAA